MRKTESGLSSTSSEHFHQKDVDTGQYLVDNNRRSLQTSYHVKLEMSKVQLNRKLRLEQIYERPGERLKYVAKSHLSSAILKHWLREAIAHA